MGSSPTWDWRDEHAEHDAIAAEAADKEHVLELVIHVPEAEPYRLDPRGWSDDLDEAIEEEARTIANDAGSELLNDPGVAARDKLAHRIAREATAALRRPGDTYKDPTGVTWSLIEREN